MIVDMPSSLLCFVMVDEQFQVVVIAANMGCNGCREKVREKREKERERERKS